MKRWYYIFSVAIICFSCFDSEDYVRIEPAQRNNIIRLSSNDTTVIADGKAYGRIRVKISDEAAPTKRNVLFTTNLGSFDGGDADSITISADTSFIAIVKLFSVQSGTATVSASIAGVQAAQKQVIVFTRAYPTQISISVDSFSINNNFNSEAVLTASLKTGSGGKPSLGHPVTFTVTDDSNQPIGAFLNNNNTALSDREGKARIRYSAGEVNQSGYLKIIAITKDQSNTEIQSTPTRIFLSRK